MCRALQRRGKNGFKSTPNVMNFVSGRFNGGRRARSCKCELDNLSHPYLRQWHPGNRLGLGQRERCFSSVLSGA